jgi:putative endonuclease
MARKRQYWVYILANIHKSVLYIGVTNNLNRRMHEHKSGVGSLFTKKYHVNRLVYCESTDDVFTALRREKQLKAGSRRDKFSIINNVNPKWEDLSKSD